MQVANAKGILLLPATNLYSRIGKLKAFSRVPELENFLTNVNYRVNHMKRDLP